MKKKIGITLIVVLAIFSLAMMFVLIQNYEESQITPEQRAEETRLRSFCTEEGLSYYECRWETLGCSDDCIKLGKNYWDFEVKTRWTNEECWCELNNETIQVW